MIPTTGKIKIFVHVIILYLMISSPLTVSILLLTIYIIVIIAAIKITHALTGKHIKKEEE